MTNVNHVPISHQQSTVRPLLIRPQSTDAPNSKSLDIPRTKRRRGKRSCTSCRQRRMKCNADTVQPCYGCAKYGVECHFRNEYMQADPIRSFESRITRLEGLLNRKLRSNATRASVKKVQLPRLSGENDIYGYQSLLCGCNGLVSANATLEVIEHMRLLQLNDYGTTRYIGSSCGLHLLTPFKPKRSYRIRDEGSIIVQKINNDNDALVLVKADAAEKPAIHPQITQNITLLQDVPGLTAELVDLAINCYFAFVQPNIPILNKLSFLQQYYYQNPHPPDEYMLSAMCAIGMEFLNFQDGFVVGTDISRDTVWSIKRNLKDNAAKVLKIAYRRSQISTLQTLIILTVFLNISAGDEDEEDSIQWITSGIAINMAQNLGLHRSSTEWNLPKGEIELRRRIWYAVYTIDAWIAAELGRSCAIHDDEFDVDLPSVYEIDSPYHTISDDKSTIVSYPLLITQAETCLRAKSPVYGFLYQVILLTHTLRKILHLLYAPTACDTTQNPVKIVEELDLELCTWKSKLPPYIQFGGTTHDKSSCDHDMLFIFYNCIKLLLHRRILENEVYAGAVSWIRSHHVCTMAALSIIDTIEGLMLAIPDYTPRSIARYSVFQAAAIFVYNTSSKSEYDRHLGRRNLARCAAAYATNDRCLRNTIIANHFDKILVDSHTTKEITYLSDNGISNEISADVANPRQTGIPHHILRSTRPEALFYSSLPHPPVPSRNMSHIKNTSLPQQPFISDGRQGIDYMRQFANEGTQSTVNIYLQAKRSPLPHQHHPSIVDTSQDVHDHNEFQPQQTDSMATNSTVLSYLDNTFSSEVIRDQLERRQSQELVNSQVDFSLALWGLYDTF